MENKTQNLPDPAKAKFKLLIYFLDGNKRVFYNYHTVYDAESKKIIINDKSALNKLMNLLTHKYAGKFKTAIIYHKETNKQIKRFVGNRLIFETPYNFTWSNFDVLFQFT